jgi:hypothetical protein
MGTPDNYPQWLRRNSWDVQDPFTNSRTEYVRMADLNKDGLQDVVILSRNDYNDVVLSVQIKKESANGRWYWDDDYAIWFDGTGYGFYGILSWRTKWYSNVYVGYGKDNKLIDLAVNYKSKDDVYGWAFLNARADTGNFACAWDLSYSGYYANADAYNPIERIISNPYNEYDKMFSVATLGAIHNISTQQKYVNNTWTHNKVTNDNITLKASKNESGVDAIVPGNPWSIDFTTSPRFTYNLGNKILYESGVTDGTDKYGNLAGSAKVNVKTTSDTQFTFTPSMSIYADYDDSLRLAKLTVGGSIDTTIGVTATVSTAGHYGYERKLYQYRNFFLQQAGAVPIVEEVIIDVYAGFDIYASATGTVTAEARIYGGVTLGGEYERNVGWVGIADTSFNANGYVTWSLNGNVAVTPYISVRPTVYIYGVVGPKFDIRPYVELKGKHSQSGDTVYDSWTLSGGVKGTLNFDLRAYGTILSRDINLFDFRTVVAGKSKYTFSGKTTDPRTVHYFTVENGVKGISIKFDDNGYTSEWMRCRNPDELVLEAWTAGTYSVPADKLKAGQWCVWVNEDGSGGYNLGHTYTITVEVTY